MNAKFCATCGAPRPENARFCRQCGKAFAAQITSSFPDATPAGAIAAPQQATPAWSVVVGDKLPPLTPQSTSATLAPEASAIVEQPSTVGPSLQGTVIQLLITSTTDIVAAYSTNDRTALKWASVRVGLTVVCTIGGLIAGSTRGFFSKLTMCSSLILAFFQSGSLFEFGKRIINNPQMLSGLLPNIVTQSLSLASACRLAWQARK